MPLTEAQIAERIQNEINDPLAALVSRLRRTAQGQNLSTEYIDDARQRFQSALASIIASVITEAMKEQSH